MNSGHRRFLTILFVGAVLAGGPLAGHLYAQAPSTLADLDVIEIRLEPPNAVARVRNAGDFESGPFNLQWWANGVAVAPPGSHGTIPAGTIVNVPVLFTPGIGDVVLRFDADKDNHVRESNEGNNSRQILLRDGVPTLLPDLLVSGLTVQPPATPGGDALVIASLTNIGGADSGPFRVRWYLGGVVIRDELHPNLPRIQSSSDDTIRHYVQPLYVNELRFEADTNDDVLESNEINNGVPRPLPDLVASGGISVRANPGGGVEMRGTSRNLGFLDSGPYRTQWSLDGSTAGIAADEQPSLPPIIPQPVTKILEPSPGVHRVKLTVDSNDVVAELSEKNNAYEREFDYRPQLIPVISFTAPVREGAPTTVVASVSNFGLAPAGTYRVSLIVDGVTVADQNLGPLDVGFMNENRVEYPWTPSITDDQMHTIRFVVDVNDDIDEQCDASFCGESDNENGGQDIIALPAEGVRATMELVDASGAVVPSALSLNGDGWPAPNPITVRVTLTNLESATTIPATRVTVSSTDGNGRFYLESDLPADHGVVDSANAFSYGIFTQERTFVLGAGETRPLEWKVWVHPSDATTLTFSTNVTTSTSTVLSDSRPVGVPRANVHPVVFLHGILGSMPPQYKLIENANRGDYLGGGDMETLDPFMGSYWPLLENLQKMGYTVNQSLFPVAYNWMEANERSAGFLAKMLAEKIHVRASALPWTASDGKVDLVSHSMGGLVARAYIQGVAIDWFHPDPVPTRYGRWRPNYTETPVPYQNDVRKVIFIATPHKGFPFNYRTWEGNNWDDYLNYVPGSVPGKEELVRLLLNYQLWPTLVQKKYSPDFGEAIQCVSIPPFLTRCLWGWAHDSDARRGVGSLRQMLPTEDQGVYLWKTGQAFPYGHETNTWLQALNANAPTLLGDRLGLSNIYVIYGYDGDTARAYGVNDPGEPFNPPYTFGGWEHGEVLSSEMARAPIGDDLVPMASADLSGILSLPAANRRGIGANTVSGTGGRHVPIPYHESTQREYVPQFLTGLTFPYITAYTGAPYLVDNGQDLVSLMAQCPINFLVTDASGRRLGYDAATDTVYREIPNTLYTGPYSEPQFMLIPSPLVGELRITVQGYDVGPFKFDVSRIDDGGMLPLATFEGETTAGQVDEMLVDYPATGQVPLAPEVDAGLDQIVPEGATVRFAGHYQDLNAPGAFDVQWDFGDGVIADATTRADHTYADNGVYSATLSVTDESGLTGSDTVTIDVSNVAPEVAAGDDVSVMVGETVSFTGSFQDPGTADTHVVQWDFGDGTVSDALATSHHYAAAGTYTVVLTVTDDDGGVGTDELAVLVREPNRAPVVEAGADIRFEPGRPVSFLGSFSDPDAPHANDAWVLAWDFGDGTTDDGSLSPTHTYADCGTFTVRLTVTDASGASGEDTLTARCEASCSFVYEETFDRYGAGVDPPEWADLGHRRGSGKGAFSTALEDGDVIYRGIRPGASEYRGRDALDWNNYDFTGSVRLSGDRFLEGALLAYSDLDSGRFYAFVLAKGGAGPIAKLVKLELPSLHSVDSLGASFDEATRRYLHRGHRGRHHDRIDDAWFSFRIRVESTPQETTVRARLWALDADEPATWNDELLDDRHPLGAGTVGVASIGNDIAIDDLRVEALDGAFSGISGDRDGDGICDGVDNCPTQPNPDQIDEDADGIGDACDDCVATTAPIDVCLDDPAAYGGDIGVDPWGRPTHRNRGGVCGNDGHYVLNRKGGLGLGIDVAPGRYRLRFQVQGRLDHGVLWLVHDGERIPIPGVRHPKGAWAWTEPVVVSLDGAPSRWYLVGTEAVGVERLELEADCGKASSPSCSENRNPRSKKKKKNHRR